ncbi:MAG TPA: hypothetical protein VLQ90_05190 [Pyrinomonadaceae bacterium]|nr:hypothetical protein [Pyrinomonadaceae bacterium]
MATTKSKPALAQQLQFLPFPQGDPVPWPFFSQFNRATQIKVAQAQLELHTQTLKAQLNAATKISAAIKGAK